MTPLQITQALKSDKGSVLWLNRDRREAAFHSNRACCSTPVDFNDAIIARGDPGIDLIETCDGEVFAAR